MLFADSDLVAFESFLVSVVSLGLALFAICYTIRESRRNVTPTFEVIMCSCLRRLRMSDGEIPYVFLFRIRNIGVSLHDPIMHLAFCGSDGLGWRRIALSRDKDTQSDKGEFARGMIADFVLRSDECKLPIYQSFLSEIRNMNEQKVQLVLVTQGCYDAKGFLIGDWTDRTKHYLGQFAYRFNRWFDRESTDSRGSKVTHQRTVIRELKSKFLELQTFLDGIRVP
jgi:hypothetical protein